MFKKEILEKKLMVIYRKLQLIIYLNVIEIVQDIQDKNFFSM